MSVSPAIQLFKYIVAMLFAFQVFDVFQCF